MNQSTYQNPLLADIDAGGDLGLTEAEQNMVVQDLLCSKPKEVITEDDVYAACLDVMTYRHDRAEYLLADR